jgi:hypothetical protein
MVDEEWLTINYPPLTIPHSIAPYFLADKERLGLLLPHG